MQRREFLEVAGTSFAAAAMAGGAAQAPTSLVSRKFARTRHGRIGYLERGRGEAALFLHGFPLSAYQWRGALELLAPLRRCIAPDFLGMGRTEVRAGVGVGPDDQVAMLVELLTALSLIDVDVVANDSGGAVAQLLMARHPERVRTLLLTNCDTEIDSPPASLMPVIRLAKAGKWVDQWIVPWHADKARARSAAGIGGMCYVDPAHPTDAAIDDYFGPLISSSRRKALANAYAVALERNPLAGVEPQLRRSRTPVRIVWGTSDEIFSAASPGYLDRTFGNSRGVRWLEGRKLFWPEELPDVVAEEATSLWTGAKSPAR